MSRHGSQIAILCALALSFGCGAAVASDERPATPRERPPAGCVFLPDEGILAVTIKRTPVKQTLLGSLPPELRDGAGQTREGEAYVVQKDGGIFVLGGPKGKPARCKGGQATVSNTDYVLVRKGEGVKEPHLVVDLRRGLLAPGITDERDGTSEIEVFAELGKGGSVVVTGTSDPDHLAVGGFGDGAAVNVNASERVPDADVISGSPVFFVVGGAGADLIDAATPPGLTPFTLAADDSAVALLGGGGNDILAGSPGTDYLQGDGGADLLDAGAGRDLVYGLDGRRDEIDCGPANDLLAIVDKGDQLSGCEDPAFSDPMESLRPASKLLPGIERSARPLALLAGRSALTE